MKFIQLTRAVETELLSLVPGTQVWINFDMVIAMEADPTREATKLLGSTIQGSTLIELLVIETPEQILRKL